MLASQASHNPYNINMEDFFPDIESDSVQTVSELNREIKKDARTQI